MKEKLLKIVFIILVGSLFSGCAKLLSPYDDEFYCKGKIEGTCGKSIKENYLKALNTIDGEKK